MDRDEETGMTEGTVNVEGTTSEMFSLMLHDRILELERKLASLHPPDMDERIELLKSEAGREVYVRLHCGREVDPVEFASSLCRIMGGLRRGCGIDVLCCRHFGLDATFVLEGIVCFDEARSVAQTARAALDAVGGGALATNVEKPVLASRVESREWFVESVRAACGETPSFVVSWNPKTEEVEKDELDPYLDDDGWCMLQGWLAHNREPVEVLHPRALHAQMQARKLWSLIARLA